MVSRLGKGWLVLPVTLALLALLFPCQRFLEKARLRAGHDRPILVPSGRLLKHICLGYDAIAADYYWLKAISYIQQELDSARRYPYLADMYDLITDLDPYFLTAYEWGAIFITSLPRTPETAVALLEKGFEINRKFAGERTPVWRLPYRAGEIYFVDKGDLRTGAAYFEKAAETPGAPPGVARIARAIREGLGRRIDYALKWIDAYEKAERKIHREVHKNRLLAVLRGANRDLVEQVRRTYAAAHHGKSPAVLAMLFSKGYLYYDPNTGRLRVRWRAERMAREQR